MKKYWFKRRSFGWGWTPVSWEGWLVTLAWLAVFVYLISTAEQDQTRNYIFIFLSVIILLSICLIKGEKPRWQWGKRLED